MAPTFMLGAGEGEASLPPSAGCHPLHDGDRLGERLGERRRRWTNPLVHHENDDGDGGGGAAGRRGGRDVVVENPLLIGGSDSSSAKPAERNVGLRLALAAASVILLWCTSLEASHAASQILGWALRGARQDGASLVAKTLSSLTEEKAAYQRCVSRQGYGRVGCFRRLRDAAALEAQRLTRYRDDGMAEERALNASLGAFVAHAADCTLRTEDLISRLSSVPPSETPLANAHHADADENADFRSCVLLSRGGAQDSEGAGGEGSFLPGGGGGGDGGDEKASQSSIQSQSAALFSRRVSRILDAMSRDVASRRAYDAAYLRDKTLTLEAAHVLRGPRLRTDLGLHLNASLEGLGRLTTHAIGDFEAELLATSLAYVHMMRRDLGAYVTDVTLAFGDLGSELAFTAALAQASFDDVRRMVAQVEGFIDVVGTLIKPIGLLIPTPAYPNLDVDLPDLSDAVSDALGSADPPHVDLDSLIDPSFLGNVTVGLVGGLKEGLRDALEGVVSSAEAMLGSLDTDVGIPGINGTLFSDYDPPTVALGFYQESLANETKLYIETAMRDTEYASQGAGAAESAGARDHGGWRERRASAALSAFAATLPGLLGFDTNVQDFGSSLGVFVSLLMGVDAAYRVFTTIAMLARYWTTGCVDKPKIRPAQERKGEKQGEEGGPPPLQAKASESIQPEWNMGKAMESIAYITGHPLWYGMFFAACLALVGVSAVVVYMPFMQHYERGCQETCEGTFVSRNAYSLATNLVLGDGQQDLFEIQAAYESEVESLCTDKAGEYEGIRRAMGSVGLHTRGVVNEHLMPLKRFDQCLGNVAYAFRDGAYSGELADVQSMIGATIREGQRVQTMVDSMAESSIPFNCTSIPQCNITCDGPYPEKLQHLVFSAACTVESKIHDAIIGCLFTVLIFVSLNAGRVLFFCAARNAFVKALTCGSFEVRKQRRKAALSFAVIPCDSFRI